MNRRGFLGTIIGALATAVAKPAISMRLLPDYVPTVPTPRVDVLYGNKLLTPQMITKEALWLWKNTNYFIENTNKRYDDCFSNGDAKIGSQLRIKLPNDYIVGK